MQQTDSNSEKNFPHANYTGDDFVLLALSLARITFLTFAEKKILLKNLDSSNSLALLSIKDIEIKIGRCIKNREVWNGQENLRMAKAAAYYCQALNIKILLFTNPEYPVLLLETHNPPFLLFCRGDSSVLNNKCVSVVGTRKITSNGKAAALDFAYAAACDGLNLISGLANGADGFVHQGAINAWFDYKEKGLPVENLGKTVAVLPSSIDEIVPYSHKKMAMQIIQTGGCILSEYEPKMPLANWHFVGRNRIIAGMSLATVIIEAPAGSGALITADFALDYDRDVIFHQAAFNSMAEKISDYVKQNLEKSYRNGKVSKYKKENTPEKFLEAGAPVIKDYKDFCTCLEELPGKRSVSEQGELFDLS